MEIVNSQKCPSAKVAGPSFVQWLVRDVLLAVFSVECIVGELAGSKIAALIVAAWASLLNR